MLALLAAMACVLLNAFFVAAEFALAKVRPTALEARANGGDRAARRAHSMTKRLDAYLSATQLGITLASLALGWIGEPAMASLLSPLLHVFGLGPETAHGVSVALGFGILSGLHIVIGELVPKSLAILAPERVATRTSWPLRAFFLCSYPALMVLNWTSNAVLRLMRLPAPQHAEGHLSIEELRLVIRASVGEEDPAKAEMIERVLRASDRPVRAIMVPRVDMEIMSLEDSFEACIAKVRRFGYSRYPVSETGEPDGVVGYVYVKDLLIAGGRPHARVADLRREILISHGSQTVGELLQEFRRSAIPIALVVDEYGGTAGLVTIEDVVHAIVGETKGELDVAHPHRVVQEQDGSLVVDGTLPVGELELDGHGLPELDGGDTVAGYVVASLGRLALPGDIIDLGAWEAIVLDVRARRVHRVRFKKKPRAAAASSSDQALLTGA